MPGDRSCRRGFPHEDTGFRRPRHRLFGSDYEVVHYTRLLLDTVMHTAAVQALGVDDRTAVCGT